mgnify:CR=1 FL=1
MSQNNFKIYDFDKKNLHWSNLNPEVNQIPKRHKSDFHEPGSDQGAAARLSR